MLLLGLTGDIACGKSSVASLLANRGAVLLDADLLVRELYADRDFARRVASLFDSDLADSDLPDLEPASPPDAPPHEYSCEVKTDIQLEKRAPEVQAQSRFLLPDGTIDRAALGRVVFDDAQALQRLETLVHPAVAQLRDRKIKALQSSQSPPRAIVLEAVKLIESGQARVCDCVWWIVCDREIQRQRLMTKRGMSESEARARLAQQPDREAKRRLLGDTPCVLIENNAGLSELEPVVEREWRRVLETAHPNAAFI